MSKLEQLVAASREQNVKQFGIMMLDLDHFKTVNDTYGHSVGDQILVQLARLIRSSIRRVDIACRYGGEEFVVLVPDKDAEQTVPVAERLRQSVAEYFFQGAGETPIRKTVSIGVACFPDHADSADLIINKADTALYDAKGNGRNQVRIWQERCDLS